MYGRFGIGSVCNAVGAEKREIVCLLTKGHHIKSCKNRKKFYRLSTFKAHRLSKILSTFRPTRGRATKKREKPRAFLKLGVSFFEFVRRQTSFFTICRMSDVIFWYPRPFLASYFAVLRV